MSPQAMRQAIEKARKLEQTIFELLRTGLNKEGAEVDKIAERVRIAGVPGIGLSSVTRAFQHLKKKEREDRLGTLFQAATVHRFSRKGNGRSAMVLVHQDFLEAHRQQFPDDIELP